MSKKKKRSNHKILPFKVHSLVAAHKEKEEWHINPWTNNPVPCYAIDYCIYSKDHPHFNSVSEAKAYLEQAAIDGSLNKPATNFPKQHHQAATKMYLERWVDEVGELVVITNGKSHRNRPKTTGRQSHMYTLHHRRDDYEPDYSIEERYGMLEARASAVIESIADGIWPLPNDKHFYPFSNMMPTSDRDVLALWLASLVAKSPQNHKNSSSAIENISVVKTDQDKRSVHELVTVLNYNSVPLWGTRFVESRFCLIESDKPLLTGESMLAMLDSTLQWSSSKVSAALQAFVALTPRLGLFVDLSKQDEAFIDGSSDGKSSSSVKVEKLIDGLTAINTTFYLLPEDLDSFAKDKRLSPA